jgi:hypothetical protein
MISDVFMDFFIPPKINADRGGGQARGPCQDSEPFSWDMGRGMVSGIVA